jgi:hypothetical protein
MDPANAIIRKVIANKKRIILKNKLLLLNIHLTTK